MYDSLSSAITEIVRFTNEHQIEAEFYIHSIGQLKGDVPDSFWARFEKRPGVYLLFGSTGHALRYIGMSQRDTGTRLFGWLFRNRLGDEVDHEDLVLSVVLQQEYMAPALESFLISKLNPALNRQGRRTITPPAAT